MRAPNPMRGGLRNVCRVCGDPSGRMTYCCSTCAETARDAVTCGRDCECESVAAHEAMCAEAEAAYLPAWAVRSVS